MLMTASSTLSGAEFHVAAQAVSLMQTEGNLGCAASIPRYEANS
jgi:hypothetical protein